MNFTEQVTKHFKEIHFGGNWTSVNLKNTLADISWKQATTKIYSFNTIAALVYHVNYYVSAVLKVLQGGPLNAHDKYSFDVPNIQSEEEWQALITKTLTDAEAFIEHISILPESKLGEIFADEKYGTYYRNLTGIIEHTHYHLGQIVILKKLIVEMKNV